MKKSILPLSALICLTISCSRDSGFGIEIYQLKSWQTISAGQEIIEGTEKLSRDPLIYYNDIAYYDSTEHYFKIDSLKARELTKTNWPVSGTAFAVTIDRTIIYSGYLVPGYSSSGCSWYCIDPLAFNSKLRVTLGYPGDFAGLGGKDERNNAKLIEFLKGDGKLRY